MDIHRVGIAGRIITPDLIHQLIPGEYLSWIGCQLIKQHEFLLGKCLALSISCYRERIHVHDCTADGQTPVIDDLASAQQRTNPQNHLVHIDGLYHVIIGAGQKALAFVIKGILAVIIITGMLQPFSRSSRTSS